MRHVIQSPVSGRLVAGVFTLLMSLILSACGGSSGTPDTGTTASTDEFTQSTKTVDQNSSATLSERDTKQGEPRNQRSRALAARFNSPFGIAIDSGGNLFVTDSGNGTVRKITPTGAVTTVAGTAGQFREGESPPPTDEVGATARFNLLAGITVDNADHIYVTDIFLDDRGRLRTIAPDGTVTTLLERLHSLGIVTDAERNLFFTNNSARTDFPTGVFRFLPDEPPDRIAEITGPTGITIDAQGNLYVLNTFLAFGPIPFPTSCTVEKISPAGEITVLAGRTATETGQNACGSTDGQGESAQFGIAASGITVDAEANLYIADTPNHTIRKVTPDGLVTTIAGVAGSSGDADGTGSAARFNRPNGITIDAAGNLYVADTDNHTIRKITQNGVVTTIAGKAGKAGSADVPESRRGGNH
jgi:sugar lactone lactonase YvrE